MNEPAQKPAIMSPGRNARCGEALRVAMAAETPPVTLSPEAALRGAESVIAEYFRRTRPIT